MNWNQMELETFKMITLGHRSWLMLQTLGHMEKQEIEMETEMEMEMENWNGNSCTVVSNHWTGQLDLPTLPLLV